MIKGKFIIKKSSDGEFYFALIAPNGKCVCSSEMYRKRSSVIKGIRSVQRFAKTAVIVDEK